MSDEINPLHYELEPKPIEVINKWKLNFNIGNVIKYLVREKKAQSPEQRATDLRKAQQYIEFEIEKVLGRYDGK